MNESVQISLHSCNCPFLVFSPSTALCTPLIVYTEAAVAWYNPSVPDFSWPSHVIPIYSNCIAMYTKCREELNLCPVQEILAPWAQSVVVGRARLGGIPVGVLVVETRAVELTVPADPANPDSECKTVSQAGQVWFPDSAYKTSQAINDFNVEDLPIIIFANWRGFSGGMKGLCSCYLPRSTSVQLYVFRIQLLQSFEVSICRW